MTTHIGRFEIRGELGRGAQSVVYLAFDPQLQREVAIKTLHFSKSDAKRNQALLSEARAVSNLKHPNIVPIYDAGEQDGDPFLVFEYVDGPNLAELIKRDERLSPELAAEIMRQVLDALAKAHAAGIIHRDLKPSNILMDASGLPRVMDFGIATRLGDQAATESGLTGTPAYMSPEYIDKQQVSDKLDVYAAGLVLLEMITGTRVVSGESLPQIAYQIAHTEVRIPADAGIDDKLSAIILKACAKNPQERLPSAMQMKTMLDDYLNSSVAPIVVRDADGEATAQSTIEFLMRRMQHKSDFPALSDSVSAINRLTSSDKESINKLSNTILKDYGLTNKIMRLVNSAFYRQSGAGNISTISRAVIVLGFDAVRNIAITVLLFEHLQDKANARELKEAFLRANLAGTLARDASKKFMAREAEEGFICALFHSLGRLLAQYYFPEEVAEIRKVMVKQNCTEDIATTRVLGLNYSDLGIGIAKYWGFPAQIVTCMRPLDKGPVAAPTNPTEKLRMLAGFANELCDSISGSSKEDRVTLLHRISKRFSSAMPFSEAQLESVLEQSFTEMGELAAVLHVNLKQSPFAKQVKLWVNKGKDEEDNSSLVVTDGMADTVLGDASIYDNRDSDGDGDAPVVENGVPQDAQGVLAAGIQDISNSLVEDFALNDILRIILEIMYRAMGFERVVLCLKDPKTASMVGRFGFGADTADLVKKFRFPLAYEPDVFHLAITKSVDIILTDIDDPKIADKVPKWYRSTIKAKTFVLFPLTLKTNPIALIYCDRNNAGSIVIPEKELTLLKTLRNQAMLAIKQSM